MPLTKKEKKIYTRRFIIFSIEHMRTTNTYTVQKQTIDWAFTNIHFPDYNLSTKQRPILSQFIKNKFYEEGSKSEITRASILNFIMKSRSKLLLIKYLHAFGTASLYLGNASNIFALLEIAIYQKNYRLSPHTFGVYDTRIEEVNDNIPFLIRYLPEYFLYCGFNYSLTFDNLCTIAKNINISGCYTKQCLINFLTNYLSINGFKKSIDIFLECNPELTRTTANYFDNFDNLLCSDENKKLYNIRKTRHIFSTSNVPLYHTKRKLVIFNDILILL